MAKKLRDPALSISVRNYIKDYIVENDLKAGDPLPSEGHLAEELGVSRSPVREAVKALQSLGIIEARQGEGLFVREWNFDPILENLQFGIRVSPKVLAELYQIRKWLEMAVIGDAVKNISDDEIMELDILMLEWERAIKSGEDYIHFDEKFHQIIFGVVGNETLLKFLQVFWMAFVTYKDYNLYSPNYQRVLKEHQDILDAIKKKDSKLSRKMLKQQFKGFQERIQDIVERSDKESSDE